MTDIEQQTVPDVFKTVGAVLAVVVSFTAIFNFLSNIQSVQADNASSITVLNTKLSQQSGQISELSALLKEQATTVNTLATAVHTEHEIAKLKFKQVERQLDKLSN